jgi:hypothetical protein
VLVAALYVCTGAEEASTGAGAQAVGAAVFDVEHGGELIAIARLKAAGGKGEVAHQVEVGKGETLLLTCAHQLRAVDFKVVDVH